MTPNPNIRFLRFEYDGYYPSGFEYDVRGKFATLEEALREPSRYDYAYIYDTWTGEYHNVQSK